MFKLYGRSFNTEGSDFLLLQLNSILVGKRKWVKVKVKFLWHLVMKLEKYPPTGNIHYVYS